MPEWCLRQKEHYRIIWVGDLWERATFMRGIENILLDVAMNPEFVQALLEHLTEYILETVRVLIERCDFEGIAISDDYGTQKGMLMSPGHWRRLVKPCLARIYKAAKKHGLTVFHHSCGNIIPIINDMIDIRWTFSTPYSPKQWIAIFTRKNSENV